MLRPVDTNQPQHGVIFGALCRLSAATDADFVYLAERRAGPPRHVRTLCCNKDGALYGNFSYELDGHPCQSLDHDDFALVADGVGERYPRALVLKDHEMTAYAGARLCLGQRSETGAIAVAMRRRPFADEASLKAALTAFGQDLRAVPDLVAREIDREHFLNAAQIREELYREYVQDNPEGISLSEFMPPIPVDLSFEEKLERLIHTGHVVECNQAIARMYGYSGPEAMLGASPLDVNGPEKAHRIVSLWINRGYKLRDAESQTVDGQGAVTWVRGSAIGTVKDGKITHLWTKRRDITAQKRYEATIQHRAEHDALTGLPNRHWFQDRIRTLVDEHDSQGKSFCLAVLDLDGFKEVNDTLGHSFGDATLREVARRLLAGLKPHGAEIARLGGDEFALIIPELRDLDRAEAMAEGVAELFTHPLQVQDLELVVGGSLGLAVYPGWSESGEDLLRMADVAMYAAKAEGLGFRWYHPELDRHSKRRLTLLTSLGTAIAEDQLFLAYQPKIELKSGALAGVEALVRWNHPEHGLLPPGEFIPLAETNQIIQPLTRRVLSEAVAQARRWLDRGREIGVAVNLSARNLLDESLIDFIDGLLLRHRLPAGLLELEITESALMTRPALAQSLLRALRERGVSLAIDDFGTGYSSLAYLTRLPVSSLKVDRQFVGRMMTSKADAQVVRSIVGLAHECDLIVVAEGVEDLACRKALIELGCDAAQGYHIARPMTAEAATSWIAGWDGEAWLNRRAGARGAMKALKGSG